jgi:hypothetical protein
VSGKQPPNYEIETKAETHPQEKINIMENSSLHSMNTQNRHDNRQVRVHSNVRQQVRDYNRANSKPGLISRAIDSAVGYELIGSIAAIAVLGSVFTVVIK